ncbi:hypothetical protein AZI86_08145 [Bdellovibrio bacteriovorus]|uniref:Uncharacterized protein n=1 Tax=Bdellovibrio bacteriovorus TaxID=959 RepID=A0A150WR60_BDEBC|nr:hypothetical protein [Bdellovibrio bacteriovorus]KYG66983.1 hypothetical protein AZI86_08145 [Bdellovibrio bacteriovorus]
MERKYTDLKPEEVDYILVKTTSGGPFSEDVFFLIFSKATDSYWKIPQSSDKNFLDWLKQFPDVNMEQFIKSMGCTEDRIFILYRGLDYPVLSEHKKETLKNRLLKVLSGNFDASPEVLYKIVDDVFNCYQESSRHYHNLEHIQNCLWELDQLQEPGIDKVSIELAIWYHDVIYSQLSKTNELKSAKKLKETLGRFKSKVSLDDAYQMIVASPKNGHELTKTAKYFMDIDFSILGQRELEYMAYKQNVRLEYHLIPTLMYNFKRKAFLKSILKRGVFLTKEFRDRYEEQAIKNIKSELSKMPRLFYVI